MGCVSIVPLQRICFTAGIRGGTLSNLWSLTWRALVLSINIIVSATCVYSRVTDNQTINRIINGFKNLWWETDGELRWSKYKPLHGMLLQETNQLQVSNSNCFTTSHHPVLDYLTHGCGLFLTQSMHILETLQLCAKVCAPCKMIPAALGYSLSC